MDLVHSTFLKIVKNTTHHFGNDLYLPPHRKKWGQVCKWRLIKDPFSTSLFSYRSLFLISNFYTACFVVIILLLVMLLKNCLVKKSSPITGLDRPRGFQEVKVPRFRDNGTGWWLVVSLTHQPPLPPGNTPGTHFC